MIRLFNAYYPVRALVLVLGEGIIVFISLLLGVIARFREDSFLVLNFEYGYHKILILTVLALMLSHGLDLYDAVHFESKGELYLRLLLVPGWLALALAAVGIAFPGVMLGNFSFLSGLIILALALLGWRSAYSWLVLQPFLREHVYVLGTGERARRLVQGLKYRWELGVDVVGWTGEADSGWDRESMASHLREVARDKTVHRVIVAMQDRRDTMPTQELLNLRLHHAVEIEEATSWLEKISGKIEVEGLYPSWIIFAKGFRLNELSIVVRRFMNFLVAIAGLILAAP